MVLWMLVNSWLIANNKIDPYPYEFFGLVLGVLAGVQAPIIMMSQNRQGEKDRLRADLDYQVNLKNELSLAEILRRLDVLESERLPILFERQNRQLLDKMNETPRAPRPKRTTGARAFSDRRAICPRACARLTIRR